MIPGHVDQYNQPVHQVFLCACHELQLAELTKLVCHVQTVADPYAWGEIWVKTTPLPASRPKPTDAEILAIGRRSEGQVL